MLSLSCSGRPAYIPGVSTKRTFPQGYASGISVVISCPIFISLFPDIADMIVDLPALYCPINAISNLIFFRKSESLFLNSSTIETSSSFFISLIVQFTFSNNLVIFSSAALNFNLSILYNLYLNIVLNYFFCCSNIAP